MDTVVDLCMDLHLVHGSLPGLVIGRIPFILTSLFTFIDQDLELENYYYKSFLAARWSGLCSFENRDLEFWFLKNWQSVISD